MPDVLPYFSAMLLIGATVVGWAFTLVGLPGNWVMVLAAAGYVWLGPTSGAMQITWLTVAALAALAAGGELAEFVAGMWGARRAGGSRRAALFALVGSLIGAALAERFRGERAYKSWQVGQAAFWGRLVGTGIKTLVATIIAAVIVGTLVV